MTGVDPAQLARRFCACELSRGEWTHEVHLAVGLWHVAQHGAAEAMPRLREGIRRLNEHNGVANTSTGGYHETITRAYVHLLDAFLARRAAGDLHSACGELLAGRLADRSLLLHFYSSALLMSARARAGWVEPDLAPLALPDWT